ncbi:hypothetical protein [Xanthomonas fragariae]|uniref:hypothetical protein n=1 Tax=Xanthomonas fragariae TaxID=48664 RepID=UPI001ABDEB6F|nr:hypothetical protein [Xanthomonas fragariae]UKR53192.1 hypothetical protein K4A87_04010 [Xanthomonas fragariae]
MSCIYLLRNLTLFVVASYSTGGDVRLSLSPTHSNNYDVTFAPPGAIFLSAIQVKSLEILVGHKRLQLDRTTALASRGAICGG